MLMHPGSKLPTTITCLVTQYITHREERKAAFDQLIGIGKPF